MLVSSFGHVARTQETTINQQDTAFNQPETTTVKQAVRTWLRKVVALGQVSVTITKGIRFKVTKSQGWESHFAITERSQFKVHFGPL